MKIVIAGGSGYLGRFVARHFLSQGYEVVTLARKVFPAAGPGERISLWDGKSPGPWEHELEGAEILLNLAGRSVNCRYSKKNREEILSSRVEATLALARAIEKASLPPKLWLNSSTATIYRHSLDHDQGEEGEIGKGFSVEIAKAWEAAFFSSQLPGVRRIALRSAMVFGPGKDGVYGAYCGIVKMGLGGPAACGHQYVSWIHIEDFLRILDWLRDSALEGVVNLAAPGPRPNREFMAALRRSLGARFYLPSPEWLLEIGAVVKRTETELLLKSRRVVPQRLLRSGYAFKFPHLEEALAQLSEDAG